MYDVSWSSKNPTFPYISSSQGKAIAGSIDIIKFTTPSLWACPIKSQEKPPLLQDCVICSLVSSPQAGSSVFPSQILLGTTFTSSSTPLQRNSIQTKLQLKFHNRAKQISRLIIRNYKIIIIKRKRYLTPISHSNDLIN